MLFVFTSCKAQNENGAIQVGGPCEGCEAALDYPEDISSTDTFQSFSQAETPIHLTGVVSNLRGTPVPDIILYVYHTNEEGLYAHQIEDQGWARRHGILRGWVKTDQEGRYHIYSSRPKAYPSGTESEHIHITVYESGKTPYYIDEVIFDDDPLLTDEERQGLTGRGGSGITFPIIQENITRNYTASCAAN